ncbi:phosphate ABC transporter substrate-binding protein [Pseudocolwellia agarivorans]|jgi:ABC-type phosphate transport system substrate-binding protein|uniref:phosphate ABC transporter substrate-binding protein n=1 Tax=Pseudocolwellia agarivorans TaxID=1911682 RepID=UPI003F88476C
MKKLIALSASLLFCSSVFSGVVVIVHPSNTATMDQKEISKVFLGKSKKFPGGGAAIPIDISSGDVKSEFTQKVLGKSDSQIKAYWSKLLFTGKGQAPQSVSSDAEVIELVSQNPSIIGYVSDTSVNDSVKVLATF